MWSNAGRNIDFRLFIYILYGPLFLFICLALAGCISKSPGIPSIYLVQIGNGKDQVRIGYFGICHGTGQKMLCGTAKTMSNASSVAKQAHRDLQKSLHDQVFVPILAIAGVAFLLGLIALSLTKRLQKRDFYKRASPQTVRCFVLWTRVLLWFGTALLFVAAYSTTQTTLALSIVSSSKYPIKKGTALQGLQWAAAALAILHSAGTMSFLRASGKSLPSSAKKLAGDSSDAPPPLPPNLSESAAPPPPPPPP